MKKLMLSITLILLNGIIAMGQTTATDFTATDCSSASHTLFTELNAGKIIVLVWVMPCGACISDAKAGYDAAQSFATSNPNRVLYWLSDDAGNTTCSALSSWASTNAIGPVNPTTVAFFGNAGNTINEANYGGSGMPHVVVLGGTNHHIYYNQLNGSGDGIAITSAITSALATTSVTQVSGADNELSIFPNPAKDKISVSYTLGQNANVSIDIYDIIGNKVKAIAPGEQLSGQHSFNLNFENQFANGMYFLKFNAGSASQTIRFTVAN